MLSDAEKYIFAEIAEEGDLYICFRYLISKYSWTLERFVLLISAYELKGYTGFYIYKGNNIIDISINDIKINNEQDLKGINFFPANEYEKGFSARYKD